MTTSPHPRPLFHADVIGSLLRPKSLRDAFRAYGAGGIAKVEFDRTLDEAIRAAVKLQEDAGLKVVTDGEFRRSSYWGRFVERCEGFSIKPAVFTFRDDHGHENDFTATFAEAKLARRQTLAADEFAFLREATAATGKITLPTPSTMHFYRCTDFADPGIYASAESFFADLSRIYREEIAELAEAGCRYVQLDEVAVAMLCDPAIRERVKAAGQDPERLVDLYIRAINDSVADAPGDMRIGIHMCRGNFRGRYLSEGGYDSIAERFFTETAATHFLLEYDTPRAGDFAPLRFVPRDKGVVLGLISSKTPALEPIDALQRSVADAAKFKDPTTLAISPQCGFASTAAGNPLTEDDQQAKLRLVVQAADEIWQ